MVEILVTTEQQTQLFSVLVDVLPACSIVSKSALVLTAVAQHGQVADRSLNAISGTALRRKRDIDQIY